MNLYISPETGDILPVCDVSHMLCIAKHGLDIRQAIEFGEFIKFPDDALRAIPRNSRIDFRDYLRHKCENYPNCVDVFLYPIGMSFECPNFNELIYFGTYELKDFIIDLDVQKKASAEPDVSDE